MTLGRSTRNLFRELSEGMVALAKARQRKRRVRKQTLYRYIEGGLPSVWLKNGYVERTTPYGKGVAIRDVAGLHKAIRNAIKTGKPRRLLFEHHRNWKEVARTKSGSCVAICARRENVGFRRSLTGVGG